MVLPAHTVAERAGTVINKDERLQRLAPALEAPEGTRPQVRILAELARALGKGRPAAESADAPAVFDALSKQDGPFKGLRWEAIGPLGIALGGAKAAKASA